MLTKIAIFLAVLIGVFVVARMGAASAAAPKRGPKKRRMFRRKSSEDLIPCATCGAYIPRGETCICGDAPTP